MCYVRGMPYILILCALQDSLPDQEMEPACGRGHGHAAENAARCGLLAAPSSRHDKHGQVTSLTVSALGSALATLADGLPGPAETSTAPADELPDRAKLATPPADSPADGAELSASLASGSADGMADHATQAVDPAIDLVASRGESNDLPPMPARSAGGADSKAGRAVNMVSARAAYLRKFKAEHAGEGDAKDLHNRACATWLVSEERAVLTSSYSESERKRRRFA